MFYKLDPIKWLFSHFGLRSVFKTELLCFCWHVNRLLLLFCSYYLFFLSLLVIAPVHLHRPSPQEIYWTKADLLLINTDIFFHFFDWPQYISNPTSQMEYFTNLFQFQFSNFFSTYQSMQKPIENIWAIWANQISLPSMRPLGNSVMLVVDVSGDTSAHRRLVSGHSRCSF